MQSKGEQHVFFGPDAALLTSNAFLEHHCFWVTRQPEHPGLVGLAFEPLPGRRVSDIRGELWLDHQTGALRFVDYAFVNLGFTMDRRAAGGRTDYQQLPNGAWIISRWEIRMPDGGTARPGARYNPEAVESVGGEVLDVRIPGAETTVLVPSFTLRGTVYDSLRVAPLARARVYLPGTPLEGYADNAGHFRIDSIPRGTYYVAFDHVRLDSMPATPPLMRVLVDSTTSSIQLATPDPLRLRASLCDIDKLTRLAVLQTRGAEELGTVRVIVRDDATGAPVKGVKVFVEWQELIPVFSMAGPRALTSTSDEKGEVTLCGIPIRKEFRVTLEHRGWLTHGRWLVLPPERVLQMPMRINIRP